jgi:serine/threonine protein kinase
MTLEPERPATPSEIPALETLVAACVDALGHGDHPAVARLLEEAPALASAAREQLDLLAQAGMLDAWSPAPARHPSMVGPYRVIEPLGRGGMGSVYLAEQTVPVRRRVAVKLIRRGMDTDDVLARFAAERQALAVMTHPHIARVFDAGTTDDGRPYFVMEHVRGLPLTEHCDRHALSTEARLGLFVAVCDGVQHAHAKGIVHRDLKPSNVLVAAEDGEAIPKIIDFGIAKAVAGSAGLGSFQTRRGIVLGTPEYMSPEQAVGDALDVDTRADVWSLGVMLYELLTGTLPFESARLRTSGLEFQRILRDEEPTSPSRKVATASGVVLRSRATTQSALRRRLRGDLDWICLKALEKDRERRYATVHDLAADVRRHLAHEPVLAGPPGTFYRVAKFVRRNRLRVAAAAIALLALVGGLAVSLLFWSRESAARVAADRNFQAALDAVERVLTKVGAVKLEGVPHMERVRKDVLVDALAFYRRFLDERGDDPRVRFQGAVARIAMARVCLLLGEFTEAGNVVRAALDGLRRLAAEVPHDGRVRASLAEAHVVHAQVLDGTGNDDQAEVEARTACAEAERLFAEQPTDVNHRRLARHLQDLAHLLRQRKPEESIATYRQAMEHTERLIAADGSWRADGERLLAFQRAGLGRVMIQTGSLDGAEAVLVAARQIADPRAGTALDDVELRELRADIARMLATLYYRTGRLDDSVAAARASADAWRGLVADHPGAASYRSELASALGNLAVMLHDQSADATAAFDAFREAVQILEDLSAEQGGADHRRLLATYTGNLAFALYLRKEPELLPEAAARSGPGRLATARMQLVMILDAASRSAEARALLDRLVADAERAVADGLDSPELRVSLADALLQIGLAERGPDEVETARATLLRARDAIDAALAAQPDDIEAQRKRAEIVDALQRLPK